MSTISICIVGDIFPGGVLTYMGGVSSEIKDLFSKFDLRVANLESALCDDGSECQVKMNDPKLGNLVYSPEKSISVLKSLNINVVSLANNHVCDCGYKGLSRTIELLDKNGIFHFGAGRNEEEAKRPAIVNIKGKSICFLGYFPPEWEAPYPPKGDIGGLNQFIVKNIVDDIVKYKKICDYVFVMPHWGKEHTLYPLLSNVYDLKKILAASPTGILGSHSHLAQTSFVDNNCIVAMSMGNFIFPDRYIISPRKTYYPDENERKIANIPETTDFPFVNTMTYVKMKKTGRIGLACGIYLDENKVKLKKYYTLLGEDHILVSYNMSFLRKLQMSLIKPLILSPFIYRVYCKFANIILSKVVRTKYRIGTWNS